MNVYVNTKFRGHYPVGVSAVVIARTEYEAADLLEGELARKGLAQAINSSDMKLIDSDSANVLIFNDGDY